MSERRHRQQRRRQRRKAAARLRSNGSERQRRSPIGREADRELADLFAGMAEIAVRDADAPTDALDAEQWASCLVGNCHVGPMPGGDIDNVFFAGFVDALEALATAPALATLRALCSIGTPAQGGRAGAAADRLAARGLPEPPWSEGLGQARPTVAALMCEEAFDDGVSVMVEFAAHGVEPHTLGVYIDHNMGGLVKDVFLAGPLTEVRRTFDRGAPDDVGLAIRDLGLAEARARVEAALDVLEHTYAPPVEEDVRPLRALIGARIRLLPEGSALPDEYAEFTAEERDALLRDFLTSPDGQCWRGDEDAEDVAALAIEFGADYNHGGPLRWSPVVVEIFMTSWLARKVTREPEFFTRVADVLRDWVAFAGRRLGVPAPRLREAVAAVEPYRKEMLEAVGEPVAWGPAKTFVVAALRAGVDMSDDAAVEQFIERYNDGLAA